MFHLIRLKKIEQQQWKYQEGERLEAVVEAASPVPQTDSDSQLEGGSTSSPGRQEHSDCEL